VVMAMTGTRARASAVIIGAGIVGNSLVHQLGMLGRRGLGLVDKGPMPKRGGSTGHASNFVFTIEYSRMMFELTEDSTAHYKELGVFTQSGGIEVARTPERMIELRRRCSQAKAWGIPAELVTPGEVSKLVPYLDESVILGGAHFPTVGVGGSLRAGTLMRESAQRSGALTVLPGTEVHGITVTGGAGGRVRTVTTSAGEIETDNVVICCGVWSPRIARMAGARLALTPAVHQMIRVGPIALFADTPGELSYRIVRHADTNMYDLPHRSDLRRGSHAHRPVLVAPGHSPSSGAARPGSTRPSGASRAGGPGRARGSTRCTASCTRPRSGNPGARSGSARSTTGSGRSGPSSTKQSAGSGRSGTPRTRICLSGTRGG